MQQYNQDEETEEYTAGKGTGELPKPNKSGRSRESTGEGIPNIDSENDPKSWNQNGITDKEESEKVSLKLNIQKTEIMAPSPITSWQIDGETMETVTDFYFLGLQSHRWWLQP